MVETLRDDFEDGIDSNWTNTSGFSASTNGAINGSQSGFFDGFVVNPEFSLTPREYTRISVAVRIQVNTARPNFEIDIREDGGTDTVTIEHRDNNDVVIGEIDGQTVASWADGVVYQYEIDIDHSADTVTVTRDGSALVTDFEVGAVNPIDGVQFTLSNDSAGDATAVIDDLTTGRLGPPQTVQATGTDGAVDLSWSPDSEADGVDIYRAESSGSVLADYQQDGSASGGSVTDSPLEDGERYYYRLVSTRGSKTSDPSAEAAATVPVDAPQLTSAEATGQGEITLDYAVSDTGVDGGVDIIDNGSLVETRDLPSRALSFDGVDDEVITDIPDLSGSITVVEWVETSPEDEAYHINNYGGTGPAQHFILGQGAAADSGEYSFFVDNGSESATAIAPIQPGYTLLGGEYDASTGEATLLVDGNTEDTATLSGATPDWTERAVRVGGAVTGQFSTIDVAFVGIWDRVLTDSEWQTLLNGGVPDNPERVYTFDGDGPVAWDASGNQHHGDIQGATRVDGPPELGDPPTATLTGLPEADLRDLTVRRTTPHTSADSATDQQYTRPSRPQNLAVQRLFGGNEIQLAWDDTSGGEDEQTLVATPQTGSTVETPVGANTEQARTDPLPRGTTYDIRVRASVGSGTTAAASLSDAVTQGVPDVIPTTRASDGYTVELEQADGTTIRPPVVGDPERVARLNGLPEIQVPVARSDHYDLDRYRGCEMRVWRDGERQPIEELRRIEQSADQTTLVGIGGVELERNVQQQVLETENHTLAEDLITSETAYATNIDDPAANLTDNVIVQSASEAGDWTDVLDVDLSSDTVPLEDDAGTLRHLQTGHVTEAEQNNLQGSSGSGWATILGFGAGYSGQNSGAVVLDGQTDAQYPRWAFDTDYRTPATEMQAVARVVIPTAFDHVPFEIVADYGGTSETVASFPADSLDSGAQYRSGTLTQAVPGGETVQVGLEVPSTVSGEDDVRVDVVGLVDGRYDHGLPDSSLQNGIALYPSLYPLDVDYRTVDAQTVQQTVAGELTSVQSGRGPNQAVAISNDLGDSYLTAQDSTSVAGEFGGGTGQIRARFTFSAAQGSATGAPVYRQQPTISSFELSATLDDTPIIINRLFDAPLVDILNEVADRGDMLWQLVWDDGLTVEWTQAGQRTQGEPLTPAEYSAELETKTFTKAIVKGPSQPVRSERVPFANGDTQSLQESFLQEASEVVRDPDGDTVYERDLDYTLDELDGTITRIPGGDIPDGAEVEVDYEFKTRGSYSSPDHSGDPADVFVETIPSVTTQRNAEQAALILVQNLDSPRWTASVTVEDPPRDWYLLDVIGIDDVNTGQLEVYSLRQTPSGTRLQLGEEAQPEQIISRIETQLSSTAQRT